MEANSTAEAAATVVTARVRCPVREPAPVGASGEADRSGGSHPVTVVTAALVSLPSERLDATLARGRFLTSPYHSRGLG